MTNTPADETVYATRPGRTFHDRPDCRALLGGQLMNDDHKVFWLARNRRRILHRVEPLRMVTAFGQGKDPCTVCYPELRASIWRSSSEDDYGHEPFEYDGAPICTRCYTTEARCSIDAFEMPRRSTVRLPVLWPCTSAVVLGLAPRTTPAV